MLLKIRKLREDAVLPHYAKDGDAGMDLTAVSIEVTQAYIEYGTGLALEIPTGHVGLLFPRSSVSKYDLALANSVGVVDSGYRGEVKLRFKRTSNTDAMVYGPGDKVGQLMIMPYPKVVVEEVESLDESERGEGGFGSSGV